MGKAGMRNAAALIAIGFMVSVAGAATVSDFNFQWEGYGSGTLNPPDGLHIDGPGGPGLQESEGYFTGTAPLAGLLTFDFLYESEDYADGAFYRVNGGDRQMFVNQSGSVTGDISVMLEAGDTFDLGVWSVDSLYDQGHLTVTNFSQVPEPSALVLLAIGACTVARRR